MKTNTLIVAGLGVAAIAAFMIYRKNQSMGASMQEGVDTTQPPSDVAATKDSTTLISKKVKSISDLVGTPLGNFISIELLTEGAKKKIDETIKGLPTNERVILENIVLPTDEIRDSEAYDLALTQKYGSKATKVKAQVIEKLGAASRFKAIPTSPKGETVIGKAIDKIANIFGNKAADKVDDIQANRQTRVACRKAARESCGTKLRQRPCRKAFRKKCKAEGGYDEGGEDFAFSFTSDRLSNENEIFAFNGHTF